MARVCALVAILFVVGCGAGERPTARQTVEQRIAEIDANPYDLTCGDQAKSARVGKRAHFGMADDAQIEGLVRLRAAQSIFYAITEICKGKAPSYRPGHEAVEGVRNFKYRVRQRP